ncbi:MAG TPA: histidinol-phosphate transaminase [Bacteroidales bacterium]|nr:histidinol-phosphate transaminase [Bacteroidales bacterium]
MFDLEKIVRPNIKKMKPYSSARNEYKGTEGVFLDANENPYNKPYNRYPDPLQNDLKEKLGSIKKVNPSQIFLGNGSDEAIDLLIRAFCEPGKDAVLSISPSYGMYEVAADTNAVEFRTVSLNPDFTLDIDRLKKAIDSTVKLIFICSPNNPSGNQFYKEDILSLTKNFDGLVVVDEAYIDFSPNSSIIGDLNNYKNLVVLQTFSKAWGLAGIRLGLAFASEEIIAVLNKIKYPYNVNILTQKVALEALNKPEEKEKWVNTILLQKCFLTEKLRNLQCVEHIYPSEANFLLVKTKKTDELFRYLIDKQVITRNRSKVALCEGCIRITVGTEIENRILIETISDFEAEHL